MTAPKASSRVRVHHRRTTTVWLNNSGTAYGSVIFSTSLAQLEEYCVVLRGQGAQDDTEVEAHRADGISARLADWIIASGKDLHGARTPREALVRWIAAEGTSVGSFAIGPAGMVSGVEMAASRP